MSSLANVFTARVQKKKKIHDVLNVGGGGGGGSSDDANGRVSGGTLSKYSFLWIKPQKVASYDTPRRGMAFYRATCSLQRVPVHHMCVCFFFCWRQDTRKLAPLPLMSCLFVFVQWFCVLFLSSLFSTRGQKGNWLPFPTNFMFVCVRPVIVLFYSVLFNNWTKNNTSKYEVVVIIN